MFSKSLVAYALASVASGHMLMNTPTPYSSPALVNSPLNADGSNFPCQLTSGSTLSGGSNTFALGSEQPLQFTGQAVHGGGSCQISITYDTAPSASSTWKVIQSIEGGCPAQGQTGNMGSDSSAADPYTYNFTVPDNIPTGDVTLAWTWFNKVGNREMYMNCAPVTLTGTSGDSANFDSLPDMFVANIDNGCATVDSTDLLFPNPGDQLVLLNGATSAFASATGTGCQAASSTGANVAVSASIAVSVGGAASLGGIFITTSASAASVAAATTSTSTSASTSVASTSKSTVTTSITTSATTSSATSAATSSSTTISSSGSTSTSGTVEETVGSACTTEGEWNCLGDSYQQCASGVWSAVMALSDGTACSVGVSSAINIYATNIKAKRVDRRRISKARQAADDVVAKAKRVAMRFRA